VGFGKVMQPFQQEQGDQGCPNLDAQCVLTGADKGLHGQVLLQRFEEQFDFPALFVDSGDGGGAEFQQVREQDDLALIFGVPDHDAAQQLRVIGLGSGAGESNELVGADIPVRWDLAFLDHLEGGILLQSGDEEHSGHAPAGEQGVVNIATIDRHNRAGIQPEGIGQFDVATLGFGDQHVGGQVVVMVQQDVGLDAAFGAAKRGPGKQAQAQRDGGRVQRQKLVVEAELVPSTAEHLLLAEARQSGPEEFLEQRGGAVFVCIGQSRAARCMLDPHMHQSPEAAPQAVADLAQGIGASQLTEQHGDELRPAGETFGGTLGVVLLNECSELGARKMLEQLIEQARNLYDCLALLVGDVWRGFWQETARQRPNYRRALHLFQSPACCFGQEWPRVERVVACPPEQCSCPACGQPREVIGYDQSEQLDVEPARYFVVVTKREKRACRRCEQGGVAAAPLPARIIDKGLVSDRVVIDTVVAKYSDH